MNPKTEYPPRPSGGHSSDFRSDESPDRSEDDLFHILQVNRRRDAISYLLDKDGPIKMGNIAEYVAAKEQETTIQELTSTQRHRVYIPLYQSHLPKLDKKGLIEYNKPRGIVRPTDRLEVFRPYLESVPSSNSFNGLESDPSQSATRDATTKYSVAALSASVCLLGASAMGMLPISGSALGALITLLFALVMASSEVSYRDTRRKPRL